MNNEDKELYQAAVKRFKNQLKRAGGFIDGCEDREIIVFLEKDLRSTREYCERLEKYVHKTACGASSLEEITKSVLNSIRISEDFYFGMSRALNGQKILLESLKEANLYEEEN